MEVIINNHGFGFFTIIEDRFIENFQQHFVEFSHTTQGAEKLFHHHLYATVAFTKVTEMTSNLHLMREG
ncbi:Uncharacterised protein [Vibrio cholerae]|nr:Uncharacterised protein [Vibrio cholerae]CSA96140.1 Uncharacterised protein [Vibrio cholerae]CSC20385.1 Uncharacterised protein [Vibrio cholerae]CSC79423.1 Uncharacterised protein [Vibrio cholerae]